LEQRELLIVDRDVPFDGLDRDCVVIGTDTRIEIWDAKAWDTYLANSEAGFVDLDGEVIPNF
jgi:MraZ protein